MSKIDETVKRESVYIAAFVGVLSVLMQAVFLVAGRWDYTVLCGNLLSAAAAVAAAEAAAAVCRGSGWRRGAMLSHARGDHSAVFSARRHRGSSADGQTEQKRRRKGG